MGLLRNGSLIPVPGVFVLCISLPSLLLFFCFLSLSCVVKIQRGCPLSVDSESAGKTRLPKTGVCLVRGPTYDLPCGDLCIEDGGSRTFCDEPGYTHMDLQDPFCTLLVLLCYARKVPFLGQLAWGSTRRMPGTLSDPCGSGALESPDGFFAVVIVFPCCAQEGMLPPALATSLSRRHI